MCNGFNRMLVYWGWRNRALQRQSVRSSRSETTDFTFDDDAPPDGDQLSTLIRRDVTFAQ